MTLELDHLFIFTDTGADCAKQLLSFGLLEGSSNSHPGQGTANRRFFFHSFMLELLWVHTPAETQSNVVKRTGLCERWRDRKSSACPFGIGVRGDNPTEIPFEYWNYCPPYLPPSVTIPVATNSGQLMEPFLFWSPFGRRSDNLPTDRAQPLNHPCGLREVTQVTLTVPTQKRSKALENTVSSGLFTLKQGQTYRADICFDNYHQGKSKDFRPHLPLVFHW